MRVAGSLRGPGFDSRRLHSALGAQAPGASFFLLGGLSQPPVRSEVNSSRTLPNYRLRSGECLAHSAVLDASILLGLQPRVCRAWLFALRLQRPPSAQRLRRM